MVQFLLRRCGSRPAKLKTIANKKIIRMKHQIGLAGISFNPSFRIQQGGPLLIAERPEIRLSSIHGDREIGLAILKAAFSQRGVCHSAYGVL